MEAILVAVERSHQHLERNYLEMKMSAEEDSRHPTYPLKVIWEHHKHLAITVIHCLDWIVRKRQSAPVLSHQNPQNPLLSWRSMTIVSQILIMLRWQSLSLFLMVFLGILIIMDTSRQDILLSSPCVVHLSIIRLAIHLFHQEVSSQKDIVMNEQFQCVHQWDIILMSRWDILLTLIGKRLFFMNRKSKKCVILNELLQCAGRQEDNILRCQRDIILTMRRKGIITKRECAILFLTTATLAILDTVLQTQAMLSFLLSNRNWSVYPLFSQRQSWWGHACWPCVNMKHILIMMNF